MTEDITPEWREDWPGEHRIPANEPRRMWSFAQVPASVLDPTARSAQRFQSLVEIVRNHHNGHRKASRAAKAGPQL